MSLIDEAKHAADAVPELFSIRQTASAHNVTLRALRFYEDRGLLQPIRSGAARIYDEATRARLQLILKGKHLGFTLSEIRDMLAARDLEPSPPADLALAPDQLVAQLDHLQRQRDDIEHAIAELTATRERLGAQHPAAVAGSFTQAAAA